MCLTQFFQTHLGDSVLTSCQFTPSKCFKPIVLKSRFPKRQEQSEDHIILPCPVCLQRFYLYKTGNSLQETDAIRHVLMNEKQPRDTIRSIITGMITPVYDQISYQNTITDVPQLLLHLLPVLIDHLLLLLAPTPVRFHPDAGHHPP